MNRKDNPYKLTIEQLRSRIKADNIILENDWEEIEIESRHMHIKNIKESTVNTLLNLQEILGNMSLEAIIEYGNLLAEDRLFDKEKLIELCANIARLKYYMV